MDYIDEIRQLAEEGLCHHRTNSFRGIHRNGFHRNAFNGSRSGFYARFAADKTGTVRITAAFENDYFHTYCTFLYFSLPYSSSETGSHHSVLLSSP